MRNHQNNHISDENLNLLLQDVFFFLTFLPARLLLISIRGTEEEEASRV